MISRSEGKWKVIKQIHVAEGELASLGPSLAPERLGLCNEGNESSRSHTSPVPDPAFGMVPVLAPRSNTKQHLHLPHHKCRRSRPWLICACSSRHAHLCHAAVGHAGVDTASPHATILSRGREVQAAGTHKLTGNPQMTHSRVAGGHREVPVQWGQHGAAPHGQEALGAAFPRERPGTHSATGAKGCPARGTSPSPSDAKQWSCINPWAGSGLQELAVGRARLGTAARAL